MIILRATRKIQQLSLGPVGPDVVSDTALGDWYVNRFIVDRRPLLLLVSSLSRLPIVTPARDVRNLPSRIASLVVDRLTRLQVPSDLIEPEVAVMSPVVVASTADRSVLGTMVDFAHLASYILPRWGWEDEDLVALDAQLGTTPCRVSRSAERGFFPDRKALELLEARWRVPSLRLVR